jgi:nitroreductase
MVLTAWIQGVGSCWVDFEHEEEIIKKTLDIPKHLKVVSFVAFGYPDSIPEPTWKKPISEIVSYNKYSKK